MSESDHSSGPSRAASPVNLLPNIQTARPYRFTWDPSTYRPGPGSVSEATEARGDYFATKLRPDVLSAPSATLPLGALPAEWSSSKHGFHAISTMLNNPHKRQAPPKAHSSLPVVPPSDLPRVRRKDFDPYLRAISAEWDRFEKNSQLGREGVAQLDGLSTPRASLSSQSPPSPRNIRVVSGKTMPPLESVPPIFLEPTFNLGDPRTFSIVTEQVDGEDGPSDPSTLSHSLPLLEKLSHYADTVEQHLVREIFLRSTSFFAALTNLRDLQSESEQCLDRITKLRGLLKDVDEKSAKRGLEVIRKECKLQNLNAVREGVKVVSGVVEMTGVAKGLVAAGQWGEALGVIEEIEGLYVARTPTSIKSKPIASIPPTRNGQLSPLPPMPETEEGSTKPRRPPPPIPILSLQAFASLPNHLRTLTMEIASSLSLEMVNVLRIDLVDRMNGDSRPPSSAQHPNVNQSLKDRLRPLLHGLVRTKGVRDATLSWREVVMGEVHRVIKRCLPTFDLDDEIPRTSNSASEPNLANHLRNVSNTEFMVLLQSIYKSFLNGVVGLQTQGSIIIDILQGMQSPNSSLDISALQEELSDILSSAAELSNVRAAKLINVRSEQNAVLDLPDFLIFFNESWNFVVQCEVICRRMIVGLRGVVISQAKAFLQVFHQTRISRSAKLVEDEQWAPCDVTPFLQHLADVIVDAAVRDPAELSLNSEIASDISSPLPPSATNGAPPSPALPSPSGPPMKQNGAATVPSTSSKHLRIEGKTYYAVSATSDSLVLLLDYLKVIVNLSLLTIDTMSRVIEFLKAFNSRTCQVVLGAGAMRSAGLKNITAKHLALASQSLSIMIALIPYVRESFRRHLSATQAVMLVEFDKLKRDYQEHQNEIHAKLIAIMGDRLTAHIKTLQMVNWSTPKQGINDYMELLVKETVTLHKVLSRYLSTVVLEDVMTQVFAAINHRLSEEYGRIELPNAEAKSRLLGDAKFLHQKLSALKNVSAPSGMLETVIAEKSIARKGPGPATQQASTSADPVAPIANQRAKGVFKAPSGEKSLPTPLPESVGTNGIGRQGDINGRVNARLSSLMSPPASLPAIPREDDDVGEVQSPQGKTEKALQSPILHSELEPSAAAARRSREEEGGTLADSGVEAARRQEVRRLPSPPPERSPGREVGDAPISGVTVGVRAI